MKVIKKLTLAAVVIFGIFAGAAHADDYGCTVLLCLSNPQGPMAVSQCVPPIKRLYDDLSHGRGFPSCAMGSDDGKNSAGNQFASADYCPPSLLVAPEGENSNWSCNASGAITVKVNGVVQSRIWWGGNGSQLTENQSTGFSDPSKSLPNKLEEIEKKRRELEGYNN